MSQLFPDNQTDQSLVLATFADPDTFGSLIDRYERPIVRYIRRFVGDTHEVVEDIAQDVFIRAYRSLYSYNPSLKFSSWLYRIAHNIAIDHLRKTDKRSHLSLDIEDEESQSLIQRIATDEDIHENLLRDDSQAGVRQIIAELPDKYQTVLVLAFLEEKSYEEISDILQVPIGTVGTLINRAKKHFLGLASDEAHSHLFSYA